MHKPKKYTERIEYIDGLLWRIVEAQYKDIIIDIYKENENGETYCQNLYTTIYGGWCVAFPGEKYSKYDSRRAEIEGFGECKKIHIFTREPKKSETEIISNHLDGFCYVLKKWDNPTLSQIFELIPFWKEHKDVELLIANGFEKIAVNKGFYKLSEKKKREVIQYILKHKGEGKTLRQLQEILKYKISDSEYKEFEDFKKDVWKNSVSYPLYKYLKKQAENLELSNFATTKLYDDYVTLCQKCNHSFKELYWKYPSNLRVAHNKVLAEFERITEFNRIMWERRNRQHKAEREMSKENKIDKLIKIVNHLEKYNANIDGYKIYFTSSLEEWETQAEKLHQCIIACGYIGKVATNQCRIAFISKDGEPVATLQLLEDNRIGQFYANELDRSNCLPSEEVKNAVNKWLETLPILLKEKKLSA